MYFAGMPFSERSKTENVCYVSAVLGSSGLNAVDLVPALVEDLLSLERGVLMYCADQGRTVLVIAPILFISAGNPRHAEICSIKMPSSKCPCRKCYQSKMNRASTTDEAGNVVSVRLNPIETLLATCPERSKHHYELASIGVSNDIPIHNGMTASRLGYKDTGSRNLLHLQSFDSAKDTPVKILHTILLGTAKYFIRYLVRTLLDKNSFNRLTLELEKHQSAPEYSRTFRHKLNYCGSFLGRDFKQFIQTLPLVMETEFTKPTDSKVQTIIPVLKKLGLLQYLLLFLSAPLVPLLKDTFKRRHLFAIFHLADDIRRFGCALNFETEKGEQMNKFIREHVRHTNGHNPAKDITIRFGKEEMLRHIIDGGYWRDQDGHSVKIDAHAKLWLDTNRKDFSVTLLGGSRPLEDNNYAHQEIKAGVCAVFSVTESSSFSSRPYIFGKARKEAGDIVIDCFEIASIDTAKQTLKARLTTTTFPLQQLTTELIIDMHLSDDQGYQLVNVCKFSSYWFFSEHFSNFLHYSDELSAFFNRP
ncbi:hypothetical protein [Absidia glauca]|uniref:Uncharacterized protein n=1 Tax=Absidia glauca TaxID=4829 RepID=A0A168R6U4_ABSGL|nr:hypothetical protein [Absidia glauca]